jgi:hypothetical protein
MFVFGGVGRYEVCTVSDQENGVECSSARREIYDHHGIDSDCSDRIIPLRCEIDD